jgi:L-amino acid N-acyltransferase
MARLRPALAADLPAITKIRNALLDTTTYEWTETPCTVEDHVRWLDEHRSAGHPALVAVDGDDVVGWAAYGDFRDSTRWPGYRFTVEHSIHVAETHWGRGIGRALLDELTDHARRAGKRVMVAGIDASNVRSIDFHARLGFVEVARMPGIGDKWGQRLDLVLMQRHLHSSSP